MSSSPFPENTRLTEVHLRTRKLAELSDFYEKALGLVVVEQSSGEKLLGPSQDGPGFLRLTEHAQASSPSRSTVGLYHFAILYPARRDLAQALQRLILQDWPIEGASDHLVSEALYLRDPENNGIELYTDRPRSQWKWQDAQVQMSTEPLNLEDLLSTAAGGSAPMHPPAQATLGHIHLHVPDLKETEAFFHQLLGFATTQRSYPGALFFSAGGYHHHIGANTWAGRNLPSPNDRGLVSYQFTVPTVQVLDSLEGRLKTSGRVVSRETSELLRIQDPTTRWLKLRANQ